jgi:hypothetical protein
MAFMERLTGPLADVLKRGRSEFNARFTAASKADVPIDEEGFRHHLAVTLDPIVRSAAAEFAERTDAVAIALFDLSLGLFTKSLLGPAARYPVIDTAWHDLLPRMPRLMAREPAQVAGAVTNALYNLSRTPGARPQVWSEQMSTIAASCANTGDLLTCGSVLAWRCGMPQYRLSALDKARSMTPLLATQVLGLPAGTAADQIAEVIQRLQVNPWVLPQDALNSRATPRELKMVAKAGAFRGFGGQFLAPPKVERVNGELIASDGTGSWRLYADVYNSLLLRCEPVPRDANDDAQIRWQGQIKRFPELAEATSISAVDHTVAVTIPTSHHLFLLGFL